MFTKDAQRTVKLQFDLESAKTSGIDGRSVMTMLTDEFDELATAVSMKDKAMILDEIVDVIYYCLKLAEQHDLDVESVSAYQRMKSLSRKIGGKDKQHELMLASVFVETSQDRVSGRSPS